MQQVRTLGFPGSTVVRNLPASAGDARDTGFNAWVGKIPWSRKWQPTPVFLPGKFHGQRSLAGYSPWGHRESDTTEHECGHIMLCSLCTHFVECSLYDWTLNFDKNFLCINWHKHVTFIFHFVNVMYHWFYGYWIILACLG